MSREIRSNSNYQLRPEDYPDPKDIVEVNSLDGSEEPSFLQKFLYRRASRILMPAGVAGAAVFGFGFGGSAHANEADAENSAPPPVIESADNLTFLPLPEPDVQSNPQDAGTPTPHPDFIDPNEEPNPAGPPVVPDDGNPDNDPPLPPPPPEPHEEIFQAKVVKSLRMPDGSLVPFNQRFDAGIDWNRNNQLDPGEVTEGGFTGPDGQELLTFTVEGNVEGLNFCAEEVDVDPHFRIIVGEGCDIVDPATKFAEVQLINENIVEAPPTPAPPTPTPVPPTPLPTRPPEVPTPTPVKPSEQPPVAVVPPVVPPDEQPPAVVQLKACPDGQVLPDAFQFSAPSIDAARLEEIKCEILGLEVDHDEQMKMLELLRTGQIQTLELLMGKDLNGDGIIGPDLNNDGKADGPSIPDQFKAHQEENNKWFESIFGKLNGMGHDIWDRVDVGASILMPPISAFALGWWLNRRLRRDGQPPAEPEPSPAAEPKPRRGGPFGLFSGVFGFFGRGKRESKQEPQKPRVPKAAAVYPHPITREPKPVPAAAEPKPTPLAPEPAPAKEALSEEAVEIFAKLMPALTAVINELRQMKDPQLVRVAKRLGEENLSLLRRAFILTGDDEREVKKLGKAKLLKRLVVKLDELSDEDKARIAQKQKELEEQKRQAAVPAH